MGLQKNSFGDQIPWKMSQQYSHLCPDFPQLTGARIVRIATHPDYQGMKYGKHAIGMLIKYFKGELVSIDEDSDEEEVEDVVKNEIPNTNVLLTETIAPRRTGKPLFSSLTGNPPHIDWIGTSFGLTERLMKFWQFNGFSPVYVCRDKNQVTGEHSCMLLNIIKEGLVHKGVPLQQLLFNDFSRRFVKSLKFHNFTQFSALTGLQILVNRKDEKNPTTITAQEIVPEELQVLSRYGRDDLPGGYKQMDYALQSLAEHFFMNKLPVQLSPFQKLILLGMGLQNKSVEIIANEYNDTVQSVLTQLRRLVKKISKYMTTVVDENVAMELGLPLEREENGFDKKAGIESFKEELKKRETLDMNLLGDNNEDADSVDEEKIGKIESVPVKRSLNDNTNNGEIKKKKLSKKKKKKNKKSVTAINVN